jgi:hypothetical protein
MCGQTGEVSLRGGWDYFCRIADAHQIGRSDQIVGHLAHARAAIHMLPLASRSEHFRSSHRPLRLQKALVMDIAKMESVGELIKTYISSSVAATDRCSIKKGSVPELISFQIG